MKTKQELEKYLGVGISPEEFETYLTGKTPVQKCIAIAMQEVEKARRW